MRKILFPVDLFGLCTRIGPRVFHVAEMFDAVIQLLSALQFAERFRTSYVTHTVSKGPLRRYDQGIGSEARGLSAGVFARLAQGSTGHRVWKSC